MSTTEQANEQLLHHALQHFGQVEKRGPASNDWVLAIIREMAPGWRDDSTIAWCSIFMNYVARNACAERTEKMTARSWLKVGAEVTIPQPGDVVIFWRESKTSWKGHVGIFVSQRGSTIYTLGGNQDDEVNIKGYSDKMLLGFRRLHLLTDETTV